MRDREISAFAHVHPYSGRLRASFLSVLGPESGYGQKRSAHPNAVKPASVNTTVDTLLSSSSPCSVAAKSSASPSCMPLEVAKTCWPFRLFGWTGHGPPGLAELRHRAWHCCQAIASSRRARRLEFRPTAPVPLAEIWAIVASGDMAAY